MQVRTRKLAPTILILGIVAMSGCSVKSYTSPDLTAETAPTRVAILPFYPANESIRKDNVDKILRQCFYDFFANLGYDDIKLDEVDQLLTENGIELDKPMDNVDLEKLSNALDADAVIYGTVTKATNLTTGVYSQTTIAARITMVDLDSGETLWTAEHSESKIGGFIPDIGFIVESIGTQLENINKELIYTRIADEFCRKVVEHVVDPGPVRAAALSAPTIHAVVTNAKFTEHFDPGNRIIVVMSGSSGMKASFNIGNWRMGIPMTEVPPGTYTGAYVPKEGDYIADAFITCELIDEKGNAVKKTCEGAKVTIGTPPPEKVTEGTAETEANAQSEKKVKKETEK